MNDPALAKILLERSESSETHLDLSGKRPLLEISPPFLLRESTLPLDQVMGYRPVEASDPRAFKAHPFEIHKFVLGGEELTLDFEELGTVVLSRSLEKKNQVPTKLDLWLRYALSPELWGPEGKWTRFHRDLTEVLEAKNLLVGTALPGYYPLDPEARPWDTLNVIGDRTKKSFVLILPWNFSLSDLRRLMSLF